MTDFVGDHREVSRESRRSDEDVLHVDRLPGRPKASEDIAREDCLLGADPQDRNPVEDFISDTVPENLRTVRSDSAVA